MAVVGSDLDFAQLAPQGRTAGLGLETLNYLAAVVLLLAEEVVMLNLPETMADEELFSELKLLCFLISRKCTTVGTKIG